MSSYRGDDYVEESWKNADEIRAKERNTDDSYARRRRRRRSSRLEKPTLYEEDEIIVPDPPGNVLTRTIRYLLPGQEDILSGTERKSYRRSHGDALPGFDPNTWIKVRDSILLNALSDTALQVYAVLIGIIFGVFSILAWIAGLQANRQSIAANQLALLSLCASNSSIPVCAALESIADARVLQIADTAFGLENGNPNVIPKAGTSTQVKIGVGVGVPLGFLLITIIVWSTTLRYIANKSIEVCSSSKTTTDNISKIAELQWNIGVTIGRTDMITMMTSPLDLILDHHMYMNLEMIMPMAQTMY
jgi:hypothetical protein